MTHRARLSRRTALASAVLAPVGVAACDLDPPRSQETPGDAATPPDADSVLVASVLSQIASAEAVIAAATDAARGLRRRLQPLARAHAAHRDLLAGAAPDAASESASPVVVTGGRAGALRAVRSSEGRLQRAALAACVDASSGDLARVLASLAAATSQHLAALDSDAVAAS